jgi:hypothetical protein
VAESTQRRIVLGVVAAFALLGLLAAFLGLGTALVLAIRAGVFSNDLVYAVRTWTEQPDGDVETETLVVSAGRGHRVRWRAVAGKSVAGRWRADDSDFKIDYDGPRDEVPFAPKVQVDGCWSEWGERISVDPDEGVVIRGWFTAPIVAGSDARSLRGRIRGTVIVPVRAAGRTFSNLG